jgi:hypothetical protein
MPPLSLSVIRQKMKNWRQQEVDILTSKGGVIALANPYDNLVTTGVTPWPPSEVVQKLYQSRQTRAFSEDQKEILRKFNGYYSDLQSIHSEDAITWSVFGTVARSIAGIRNNFISELFNLLGIKFVAIEISEIFLWRRIPHPDTLVSGGPEIDFGILTKDTLLLGEAKWKSSVSTMQGKNKDKNQIQLRVEFLQKYANKLYPDVTQFVVLGVGLKNDVSENCSDKEVKCIGTTWRDICSLASHPNHHELLKYLDWKTEHIKNG